jgi:hypothetical protein
LNTLTPRGFWQVLWELCTKTWIFIQRRFDNFAWDHFAMLFLQQLHQKINLTTTTNREILTLTLNVCIYKHDACHCMLSCSLSFLPIMRLVSKRLSIWQCIPSTLTCRYIYWGHGPRSCHVLQVPSLHITCRLGKQGNGISPNGELTN